MKKGEIDTLIKDSFKKTDRYFHKMITSFETEDIFEFRAEIKKLKIFLHLLSMESADGISYRITKRMKTLYGYVGIIRNLQLQIEKVNDYLKKHSINTPLSYLIKLQNEIANWKKNTTDFIEKDYNFLNDEDEILAAVPDKLTKKSIKKFIHYTLYEIGMLAGRLDDDESFDNMRKLLEDIFYNWTFIEPYVKVDQTALLNKKQMGECLQLFWNFRDKCMDLTLLETYNNGTMEKSEAVILKALEQVWLKEKQELKSLLCARIGSPEFEAGNF